MVSKTVSTLTAVQELMYDRFEIDRCLVIAPKRVAESTWPEEIDKWEHIHLTYSVAVGSAQERKTALHRDTDLHIINRENVPWLVELLGSKWPYDMVVLDELSSFKSNKAQRFKALRKVRSKIKRIVGLTGTPTPNGLIDLWPQIYLLDQGERLGKTITKYRDDYFRPGWSQGHIVYKWQLRDGAEDQIYEKLEDICISMKSTDWLTMPERIDQVVTVEMDAKSRAKYDRLEKDMLLPLEGSDVVADGAAVLTNKLLQLANGAIYDEDKVVQHIHDAKLDRLEDAVEAANGRPLLVYYSYRHDLDRIRERFPQAKTLESPQDIKDWNDRQIELLVCHPASAGHGLNLQDGGSVIIWFGLPWSLELYQQANARLYRQGQRKTVRIYHIVTKNTMDEQVLRALERKDTSQEALMAALKAKIKEATANDAGGVPS